MRELCTLKYSQSMRERQWSRVSKKASQRDRKEEIDREEKGRARSTDMKGHADVKVCRQ